ncbi:MAG: hypothetical protein LUE98_03845, partial [Tannerellaceae bacterium]|nr:hypothetical protein [Tannerellaceae bacterium]
MIEKIYTKKKTEINEKKIDVKLAHPRKISNSYPNRLKFTLNPKQYEYTIIGTKVVDANALHNTPYHNWAHKMTNHPAYKGVLSFIAVVNMDMAISEISNNKSIKDIFALGSAISEVSGIILEHAITTQKLLSRKIDEQVVKSLPKFLSKVAVEINVIVMGMDTYDFHKTKDYDAMWCMGVATGLSAGLFVVSFLKLSASLFIPGLIIGAAIIGLSIYAGFLEDDNLEQYIKQSPFGWKYRYLGKKKENKNDDKFVSFLPTHYAWNLIHKKNLYVDENDIWNTYQKACYHLQDLLIYYKVDLSPLKENIKLGFGGTLTTQMTIKVTFFEFKTDIS